jgi:response regulator RpfG family c-di-GMP phosphodiesterase
MVLMDIRMPGIDGLEATRRITADPALADVRIIVLTTFEIDEYVFDALRSGASGFLLKDTKPAELLQAIRTVADGGALLAPSVTRKLIRTFVEQPARAVKPHPLLDTLTEYEYRTRYRARRELRERDSNEVSAAIDAWLAKLDPNDENLAHHKLEALWVKQHHDLVDDEMLKDLLREGDYRARAAATRVLCYWRDRVSDPLGLLQMQVNDDHPRVRLEAVRALSFFRGDEAVKAQEIALESLIHPQDYYLEYTLNETLSTLEKRTKAE